MTTQEQKLDDLQIRFARLAWLSFCLSLVTCAAHVRAFPSYNSAASLVALYTSNQDNSNTDILLRNNALFTIVGGLTTLADIVFCIIWAGEITLGYSGLMKISLVAFISNILIKGTLLYSALTVWAAASSTNSDEHDHDGDREEEGEERTSPPKRRRSPLNDSFAFANSPIGSRHTLSPEAETNEQLRAIPGLVSPGFDPRNRV
eukprot:scaffold3131_cov187-Skeletonema_menzelii.AAC.6